MTQAQKWANEAMHLKNENVDFQILNMKLLEALELIVTHIPGTAGHPSVEDCRAQMHADATIAIKAAKDA